MTEEEAEEILTPSFTPEVLPEQVFQVMVKDANLDQSRANYLLQNFTGHFKEAAEWAKKAKDIIVTNENQTVMMEMARTGRLFLAKKRQEIEKARKWMKEPALREGQAIDKIANLLKDTIIPTEEHLRRQEDFVKLRQEAEAERVRLEVELRLEKERIEEEKRKSEENARLQAENERLRVEAENKEKALAIERKKVADEQEKIKKENEAKIAEENRKRQEELELVRKENEAKLAKEREIQQAQIAKERAEREKVEAELRQKRQAEMKAEADRIKAEERAKSAGDNEKLIEFHKAIAAIVVPEVKSKESIRMVADAKSHLYLAMKSIIIQEEE